MMLPAIIRPREEAAMMIYVFMFIILGHYRSVGGRIREARCRFVSGPNQTIASCGIGPGAMAPDEGRLHEGLLRIPGRNPLLACQKRTACLR
jgi:hypothetical protein